MVDNVINCLFHHSLMRKLTQFDLVNPNPSVYRTTLPIKARPIDEDVLNLATIAKRAISDISQTRLLVPFTLYGDPFDYLSSRGIYTNVTNRAAGPIFRKHASDADVPQIIVYGGLKPFDQVCLNAPTNAPPYIGVDSSGIIEEAVGLVNLFRYGNLEPMASVVLSPSELKNGFDQAAIADRIAPFRQAKVSPIDVSKFLAETGFGFDVVSLLRLLKVRLSLLSLPAIDDPIEQTQVLAGKIAGSGIVGSCKVLAHLDHMGTDRAVTNATVYDIASGNVLYRLPREIMQALAGRPSILVHRALLDCVISLDGKRVGPSAIDFAALLETADESIPLNVCQHLGFAPDSPQVPEIITEADFPKMLYLWQLK